MPLDLSKLTDAIAKVSALAVSHADLSTAVMVAENARDAAIADLAKAQQDIDGLAAQLLASATTPAETAGITAVAAALTAPVVPVDTAPAPVFVPVAPVAPVEAPVFIPVAPKVAAVTYLPGDPRNPANK